MTGLAVALVFGTAVVYVLLRRADRWAWHELPPEQQVEPVERLQHWLAQLGLSAAQARRATARMGAFMALAGDTWARDLHWPHDPGNGPVCHFDGNTWPCPVRARLEASVATRRAQLAQPSETVGDPR